MEILYFYALFAVTTAITSLYELIAPVVHKKLELDGHIENKAIIYLTFFLLSILIAPFTFISCIIPEMGIRFREGLYDGLFPKE